MRVGFNPHKDIIHNNSDYCHQVIVPVYVPHFEGYFKDGLSILKLCLESLIKTVHKKTFITIVNNGSCAEVQEYLNDLLKHDKINELIHTNNIGKLNAVLKGLSGNYFDLVTITDADVMFLNNWQTATYDVFKAFPKSGAVCPTPSSRSLRIFTANIYYKYFLSKKMIFKPVQNQEALRNFAHSVGNDNFYNQGQLDQYLTINNNNVSAVVGCGHFVATYRYQVFDHLPHKHSNYKLGGDSEFKILDLPVINSGFFRLSTAQNYAYHLGNVQENWMQQAFATIEQSNAIIDFKIKPIEKISTIAAFIQNKLFGKYIFSKYIFKTLLKNKGLKPAYVNDYF